MATDDIIPKNIGWSQKPILCKTDSPEKNQVKVILKGMCSESFIDTEFFLDWVPMNNNPDDQVSFYYQGRRNSTIIYKGDRQWEITDRQHWFWGPDSIVSKNGISFSFFINSSTFEKTLGEAPSNQKQRPLELDVTKYPGSMKTV